jgi:1,4-alpha-glucan branching enzyme
MSVPESSWGDGGHHDVWMSDETQWTWYMLYNAELRFTKLLTKYVEPTITLFADPTPPSPEQESSNTQSHHGTPKLSKVLRRILTQALRELLLLQASDWQFLITTISAKDYAEQRLMCHYADFSRLCTIAEQTALTDILNEADEAFLAQVEERNSIFKEIRLEWWFQSSSMELVKE